ncbi:MAG TPA: Hsp20/alpha crystallin family protein [Chloroflexia bacterium]|nr:Hsp20/alpha crystallin family protein [Chloroflexia bacterium]
MQIEKWNPFRELAARQNWMDRFMEEFFGDESLLPVRTATAPAVDLKETEKGYELHASMPGYKPEDIQIEINQDLVTLRGELKPEEHEEKKDNYIYRERRTGSFYRQIRLPAPVDMNTTEAELKDGVLSIVMPKLTPTEVKRVEVKATK